MNHNEINFGIEIETVKRTREQVALAIHSVVGGTVQRAPNTLANIWQVQDLRGRTLEGGE